VGNCNSLAKTDCVTCVNSFHVAKGIEVIFQATRSDGAQHTSQPFIWLAGDGTSEFEASFTPKAQGNDWWIEVDVEANQALAGVDARIDSGTWKALEKKSWGSWAKSLHAPDGSEVQFRATSTGGTSVTSETYIWP
jgi:heme/copper-type cytochrome/quinol oxidase subunit 2